MSTPLGLKKEIVISEGGKVQERKAILLATKRDETERKQQIHEVRLKELKHATSRKLALLSKSHMAC